jgi:hypothetical protein
MYIFLTLSIELFSKKVKIISGREEALDAWISANYFEDNFNSDKVKKNLVGSERNFNLENCAVFTFKTPRI